MTKYFLDSEFFEDGPESPIRLISIALVCEDGREFYREEALGYYWAGQTPWLLEKVRPHLIQTYDEKDKEIVRHRGQIAEDIKQFMNPEKYGKPEVWGYFSSYDWVVFCQLFGRMIDLPKGFPYWCRDLKQEMDRLGIKREMLPPDGAGEHSALVDARWIAAAYEQVQAICRAAAQETYR